MIARTGSAHFTLSVPAREASSTLPLTPVSLIATQCLSQTSTAPAPVNPDTVKLLFKLKQISISIDFAEEEPSIQQKLNLSVQESTLLNAILAKWLHLKEMSLHNICGVSIFDKITSLIADIEEKHIAEISSQFSTCFFDTYLRLERDSMKVVSQNVTFQNTYIPTWPVIKRRLEMFLESIALHCPTRSTSGKGVVNKKQARFRAKTLAAIKCEIDLFIKLHEHEQGKTALSRQSMHLSLGQRTTDATAILDDDKLDQLHCYARFVYSMISYTHKEGECLFFERLCQHLPLLKSDNLAEGVKVLQSDLNDCFALIAQEQPKLEQTIQKLLAGKITHAQWAANHEIHLDHIKCKEEFLEQMLFHVAFFFKVDFFASQFQKCFEHEIVRPAFPDFASTVNHIQRFLYNIKTCTKIPMHHQHPHHLAIFHHGPVDIFGKKFSKKIVALELFFKDLLNHPDFIKLSKSDFNVLTSDLYNRGVWHYKLSKFSFIIPLLEAAKREMQQTIFALNKDFKEDFENIKDLPENEKQVIIDDVQALCNEQSLFLVRMVMIAEDISAVLNGDFSFKPLHIPQELVNLMHLDAFDDFLTRPRRDSTSSQGRNSTSSQEGVVESPPPGRKERRPSQQLVSIYDLDLERRDSQEGKLQQEEKVKKETDLEAIKLASLTRKTYKILNAFEESGYEIVPGKCKHINLRKPGEPPVTLPRALEQGTGMSYYIQDMLGDSLHLVKRPSKEG